MKSPAITSLDGKVALVTGAGRGIGRAASLSLARQGAHVVVAARTKGELDSLVREIEKLSSSALAVAADVSRENDVDELIRKTVERFGRVDVLVNNAGIGAFAPVAELSVDDFDRMCAVNMRGVFLCTRAVVPLMSKQLSGDIVNISSLAGRNAFVGGAGYAATKWALIGFSRCLMLEVRDRNIRVITLCPGSVDTTFGVSGTHPKDATRIPQAEDIAQVIVNALLMPRTVMVSEIDIRPTNPKG
jgi:NADP-dependent 3-hydroxy acid dehydrogenase YdfG